MNTKSNLPAITFAIAALVAAIPSSAIASDEPPTEKVRYGDLNLATEEGVEALDRRLDRAVKRVCGEAHTRDLITQRAIRECERTTWHDIRPEREFAIAQATGQQDASQQFAGRSARAQTAVALSE